MPAANDAERSQPRWVDGVEGRVRAKKRLGQHFLVNRGLLEHILATAEIAAEDTVIEVGPGTGILTKELVQRAGAVVAVELDRDLARRLRQELAEFPNLTVIQGDILAYPPQTLMEAARNRTVSEGLPPYKVVANLPYYITAPTLRHFLASPHPPTRLVVMVQYEVAKTIAAAPGEMSLLSVAVQFYGKPEIIARVAPASFRPPPQVHSAILRIDVYPECPVEVPSQPAFFEVVRAGYSARRKQIRNAFAQAWHVAPAEIERLLVAADIDPSRRAQSLSLQEWASITRARVAVVAHPQSSHAACPRRQRE